jgi:GNAT superfamily N-acetyltransferase
MNAVVQYRTARVADAKAISELMLQLGYETPADVVGARILSLDERRDVFVAAVDSHVIGWIAVSLQDQFVTGPEAVIEGFVIDESMRSRGIGGGLLRLAEAWCRGHGCASIRVHSNIRREAAHAFYQKNGYELVKTQHQFLRIVTEC